ncbi:MAG: AAA family ATPase [Kofleriaceae bacterium]
MPNIEHRLAGDAVFAETSVPMVAFFVDVEPEGHAKPTDEWRENERAKVELLFRDHRGGFAYDTRGGYRIVYKLAVPFVLESTADKSEWAERYLAWLEYLRFHYAIVGDVACKDWGRLYRLPRVVRDGKPQELPTFGDASAIGVWSVGVSLPKPAPRKPRENTTPIRGSFDMHAFMATSYAGTESKNVIGAIRWDIECPWTHEHSTDGKRSTSVFLLDSGAAVFKCLHTHCASREWNDFRRWHQPDWVPFDERTLAGATHVTTDSTLRHDAPDVVEVDPFQQDIATALVDVRNALSSSKTVKRSPMFSDAAHLLTMEFPLVTWAIVGLLTRGGVGIIGGEPKTIKTWLALEFALAIAMGRKALGEFKSERGVAVMFCAEDLAKQMRNRLRGRLKTLGVELKPGRLFIQPRGTFIDVLSDDDMAWLVASCRKLGKIDLLVLDPLRDLHSGEEDKSDSMRDVMRRLRLLGELLGCTVLVVHHTIKASDATSGRRPGQRLRGSSAIHGSLDAGIYMSEAKGGDGVTKFVNNVVSEVKGARSAGLFALELTIEDDADGEAVGAEFRVIRVEKTEKPATARDKDDAKMLAWIAKLARDGVRLTRRKLRDHEDLPMSDGRARDALERLLDAGRIELDDDRGGIVVLSQTVDGKTLNDFIGVRGIPWGESRSGMVGRTPIGSAPIPTQGDDDE